MSDWKRKMMKPSKRTLIYSKKLNQWLAESDEDIAMLELLHDKREAIMSKIKEVDTSLSEEEAKSLAEQMLSKPDEALRLLKENEDEPEAFEKEVKR